MGTYYRVVFSVHEQSLIPSVQQDVDRYLTYINHLLSTYIPNSEINEFNQNTSLTCIPVSEEFLFISEAALKVHQITQGAFDPSLAPLIALWGFDKNQIHQIPSEQKIKSLLQYPFAKIHLNKEKQCIQKHYATLQLNYSAIAKGFAVDEIAKILRNKYSIEHFLVDIGGEIIMNGVNHKKIPWRVAIETPSNRMQTIQKIIHPGKMAVATSGDYRNYFEKDGKRFSHLINPKTGYPIDHTLASVTVVHASTMIADAYATAFMILGPEKSLEIAKQQKLAIFMIIKTQQGFSGSMSPEFSQYLNRL